MLLVPPPLHFLWTQAKMMCRRLWEQKRHEAVEDRGEKQSHFFMQMRSEHHQEVVRLLLCGKGLIRGHSQA